MEDTLEDTTGGGLIEGVAVYIYMASEDTQNLIINCSSPIGLVLQVMVPVLSRLIVELANSTVWPEVTFCDCGIPWASEQAIPVKLKNNINSCYWLVVSTQIHIPFTNSVIFLTSSKQQTSNAHVNQPQHLGKCLF